MTDGSVTIANRSDGGILHWTLKLYGFAACIVGVSLMVTGVCLYGYFANQAPPTPRLENYVQAVPAVSTIFAADDTKLGEFADEWRELAAYDEIPKVLIHAFVDVEDHEFFTHKGIYFTGIARAVWRNVTAGDFAQGGSTITQQLTKQFLTSDKSLSRKAVEAIIARRLEAKYPKEAILAAYLNEIYLGFGAYGVRAAAKRYFSKDLADLTPAEAAMIAGLAQAPSRYSPVTNMERALERRNLVLDQMAHHGHLESAEAEKWKKEPIILHPHEATFGEVSPYYAEHIRRYMTETYGAKALQTGGYRIETAADPVAETLAYENVRFGARKQDKREGWRGPEAHLDGKSRDAFRERSAKLYGHDKLIAGKRYLALVEKVEGNGADVLVGSTTYRLPLANMHWAAKWQVKPAINDQIITSAARALTEGDVIWVAKDSGPVGPYRDWRLDGVNPRWIPGIRPERMADEIASREGKVVLEQVTHPQGAMFVADHETGYVNAIIGGTDYERSEYNRAIQSCRQPASTYKAIYYSAALNEGYGFDSELNDIPRKEVDPVTGEVWTPENLGGTVDNNVTLEYALVFSKNVPSVDIFKKVGADNVEKWARRLGFTTEIIADKALALGASCTLLPELTKAFAIFARNGRDFDWVYVRRVIDRDGNIIDDHTTFFDPMLTAAEQIDRVHETAGKRPKQAIPARAAYLTSKLLSQAIEHGFSWMVRQAEIKAAGKTGTSSETMDTTFVGYTSRWITTVWLGDDQRERPLGVKDAAYMTVVPMWTRFMNEAAKGHPNKEIPWWVPEGVSPNDRGDNKNSRGPMPLVYRKHSKPEDDGGAPEG